MHQQQTDTINDIIKETYESFPYKSWSFPHTNPDHIAAVASVYGLNPPDITQARVLELGCASAGNLIPLAIAQPEAQFVGIDISQIQIDQGKALINHLGLTNIELIQNDLKQINRDFGQFDYIICHGVYSWVPKEVQTYILQICQNNLSENGIAYISYNTYPGWKSKEVIRDAMLLRAKDKNNSKEALSYAKGMYNFLAGHAEKHSLLHSITQQNSVVADGKSDYYLVHEYLEPVNIPSYFSEFLENIHAHQLCYLTNAAPEDVILTNFAPEVSQPILNESKGDLELAEQYLDFIVNRSFRESLIVHEPLRQTITRKLTLDSFKSLHIRCHLPSATKLSPDDSVQTVGGNITMNISGAITKALVKTLTDAYPSTVAYDTLYKIACDPSISFKKVKQPLALPKETAEKKLLQLLSILFERQLGKFFTTAYQLQSTVNKSTDMPYIKAHYRQWIDFMQQDTTQPFSNLYHEGVRLDPLSSRVFSLCDGTRTYTDIYEHILEDVNNSQLTLYDQGKPVHKFHQKKSLLKRSLEEFWKILPYHSLLSPIPTR